VRLGPTARRPQPLAHPPSLALVEERRRGEGQPAEQCHGAEPGGAEHRARNHDHRGDADVERLRERVEHQGSAQVGAGRRRVSHAGSQKNELTLR